eukprot:10688676-Alexandrium_andersonii.AAC.1
MLPGCARRTGSTSGERRRPGPDGPGLAVGPRARGSPMARPGRLASSASRRSSRGIGRSTGLLVTTRRRYLGEP